MARSGLLRFVPRSVRGLVRAVRDGALAGPHFRLSFAQEGEDLALDRLFADQKEGFYVDVGAHHPVRYSNTHRLHKRGWRGINIDPFPGSMEAFTKFRPRDVNLEVAVSDRAGTKSFFIFDEPALNSLEQDLSTGRDRSTPYKIVNTIEVRVERLDTILAQHVPPGMAIDLLSIDTEGHDDAVINSNDWDAYRPRVVLMEVLDADVTAIQEGAAHRKLTSMGYRLWVVLPNSVIYTLGMPGSSTWINSTG